jgi:hypothetical protein
VACKEGIDSAAGLCKVRLLRGNEYRPCTLNAISSNMLVLMNIMILNAVQGVLFNKFVCAAYRAAHVARQWYRAIRAHAMLCTVVLTEVQRCCSAFDRTQCSAGTLEGGSE